MDEIARPLVAELRVAVASALASLETARREALTESESGLVQLAVAIAERVVGRELRGDPALIARWVHEGIAALHGEDQVSILAAPGIAAHLEGFFGAAEVAVEVDPHAEPGTCIVRGRWGRVDAGMRARLDATIAALEPPDLPDLPDPPEDERRRAQAQAQAKDVQGQAP